METNSETSCVSMLELEGFPVTKEGAELSPPANVPITDYSVPPIVEKLSSQDPSFSIHTPVGASIN